MKRYQSCFPVAGFNQIFWRFYKQKSKAIPLIRWVSNKEKDATRIQQMVSKYFLTQRIRPDAEKYTDKLSVLHKMLQAAMKCKHSIDPANVQILRSVLKEFEILYFGQSHH